MTDRPVRFIVLSHYLCGAGLLLSGLDQRPGVKAFGEPLNASEDARRMCSGHELAAFRLGDDGAAYLDRQLFGSEAARAAGTVGCLMAYGDARADRSMHSAWTYLIEDPDIRVIHLTRRNRLEHLVEMTAVERVQGWLDPSARTPDYALAPFSLSSYACQEEFDRQVAHQLWARRAFAGHPLLELEFERDIRGDFRDALVRVCRFLDVDPPGLGQPVGAYRPQIRVSPQQLVVNYQELKEHFRYTLYQDLFAPDRVGDSC